MEKITKILLATKGVVASIGIALCVTYAVKPSLFPNNRNSEVSYFLGETHDDTFYSTLGAKITPFFAEVIKALETSEIEVDENGEFVTSGTEKFRAAAEQNHKITSLYYVENNIICYDPIPITLSSPLPDTYKDMNEENLEKLFKNYNVYYLGIINVEIDDFPKYSELTETEKKTFKDRINVENSGEYNLVAEYTTLNNINSVIPC